MHKEEIPPWALDTETLFTTLATKQDGLTESVATERLSQYGYNEFKKNDGVPIWKLIIRQFSSPLIFMLLGASIITIILNEWIDTVVILLAITVNGVLGFYQEYRAEHTLETLRSFIKNRTRVIRNNQEQEIDATLLVPGDIIHILLGSRIPADCRIISSNGLSVDESFLTGESLPIKKYTDTLPEKTEVAERKNMVFAGSLVIEGTAQAVVTHTGTKTEIGKIAELLTHAHTEQTPLQKSLGHLAWVIFIGVMCIITLFFFLGISRGEPVLQMLLLSAAVAVGAIPEALPIALTVILGVGVERIGKRNGIMRSLSAAETLGSATLIMTDKTGTLTQAKMELVAIQGTHELLGKEVLKDQSILEHALRATEVSIENSTEPSDTWKYLGRPLEVNIGKRAHEQGLNIISIISNRIIEVPFNSTNKFSIASEKNTDTYSILGAPDILLSLSSLSDEEKIILENKIHAISAEGKRLLGVATISKQEIPSFAQSKDILVLKNIQFIGVLVLYDPVRKEAQSAIERIEAHGARVIMITGDLKGTALSVGRELGWNITDEHVLTGEVLHTLSDEELIQKLPHIRIFARVTPEDKLRVGLLYQKQGEVVAMTGDGVNDAPSLRAVDIGIALGSGSDVSKGVADLVLLDDNFQTIVYAIEEGRRIMANIRKAFVYLMSNCLDEVILLGGSLLVGIPLPLTALQIIWVNFFTGSLPALSFAYEENRDVGYGKGKKKKIFNKQVRVLTLWIGTLTSLLLFFLYFGLITYGIPVDLARTILFMCFTAYTIGITFSFKSIHLPITQYPLFDNKTLNISVLISLALTVLTATVPYIKNILGLVSLPSIWILFILAWCLFNILIVEIAKYVIRKK